MYSVIYNRESEKDQKIIWDHTHSNAYYDKNALISTNKTLNLSNINLLHSKAYDCKKKKKCFPGESGKNEPIQQGRGWRENEENVERGDGRKKALSGILEV